MPNRHFFFFWSSKCVLVTTTSPSLFIYEIFNIYVYIEKYIDIDNTDIDIEVHKGISIDDIDIDINMNLDAVLFINATSIYQMQLKVESNTVCDSRILSGVDATPQLQKRVHKCFLASHWYSEVYKSLVTFIS